MPKTMAELRNDAIAIRNAAAARKHVEEESLHGSPSKSETYDLIRRLSDNVADLWALFGARVG